MSEVNAKEHLAKEQKKLADLLSERERIEVEIAKTKRRIAAWAELCDETDLATPPIDLDLGGLTDACITVLRSSRKEWLNTGEVQNALKELGFPISNYKAPNASIATTLNRLVENGYVVSDKKLGEGAIEYKWAGRYVVGVNRPGATDDPARKLGEGTRFPKRGVDTKLNAADESGMRGNEKPKK